jgi:phenylacetate-CoA ligase
VLDRLWRTGCLAWHLHGQRLFPFKPLEEIRHVQTRRLRRMVRHAYLTVPYYRDTMRRLGLKPEDFRSVDDLGQLPVIEREHLLADPAYFVSTSRPLSEYVPLRTGGTSGIRNTIYWDKGGILENAAHAERERCMLYARVGRRFGYRETNLASALNTAPELQNLLKSRAVLPGRLQIRRQFLDVSEPPARNLALLNEFRPDIINGFGSYLGMLFAHIADTDAAFHRPHAVTYNSDALPDSIRRLILEKFRLPLFSTYEAHEGFKIGFECDANRGLHLNMDLYPVRIVDAAGRDLPPGQCGEVLVSNLVNRGTVLFNCRLNDLAMFLPDPCPCGRTLPMLSLPQGRSDDFIELPGGGILHPQRVRLIFAADDNIWQYQVLQEEASAFVVKMVVSPRGDRAGITRKITRGFAEALGQEVRLDLAFVEEIERTASGKLRAIITRKQQALRARGGAQGPGEFLPSRADRE